ncbi:MAG: ubiquinone-binding protein [Legionellales bacterium]|nr:ubiquinone-binding protein [Legionellales bacterium]|tara:strand:- start:279 stop:710 length:432 start_codon:yes stop_codon:yes gene_type:complete
MVSIKRNAVVPYTPSQMFDLVDKIEDYPNFLPWCKASEIHERNEDEVKATLTLAKGGIEKSFTTHNYAQKNKMIEVRLIDGPFKHLEGFWLFEPVGENMCKIKLDLAFEFSNSLVSFAIGPIFQQIANTLVEAFCERAKEVYG